MIELIARRTRARQQKRTGCKGQPARIDPCYGKLPRTSSGSLQLYVMTASRQGGFGSNAAHVDRRGQFVTRSEPAN